MIDNKRQWQVTLYTSKEKDVAPQVFFDESLVKLRNMGNEYHDDSAVYYVLGHTEPDAF